jgi:hypothetical protein
MLKIVGLGAVLAMLAGCASSSGAYLVGPDTYRITTTAITSFGGEGTAKASAVHTANQTCARLGKTAMVVADSSDAQFTQASTSVTFKCVT